MLEKTQQNRTAHISKTLSISSGKSPRETRISSGTAKARRGLVLAWLRPATAGGSGDDAAETCAAASVLAGQVYLR